MTKRLPLVMFITAALIGGAGSYGLGVSGVDPALAITQGRCSSGAFITHAKSKGELAADARANTNTAAGTIAESTPANAVTTPAVLSGPNLMPNPGLEAQAGAQPAGWSGSRYGNNDAVFSQVAGRNSGRAVRVDITKYNDGTASWYPSQPIAANPGGYYLYVDSYRANVPTHIDIELKDTKGKFQYYSIGSAPASTAWTNSAARFFVPMGTTEMRVSHTLDRLGSLETDDYSLAAATPTAFREPLVSVTFDDGYASAHDVALPIMQRSKLVSTQYLVSGYIGAKGYVKPGQVYDYVKAGDEVAAHTLDHADLTTLTPTALTRELSVPQKGLTKCYGAVTDFAAPYGAYNAQTTAAIKGSYSTARSTDPGFNSADSLNPYELKVENIRNDTTPEQIQSWLDTAKANGVWLILVYHQVDNSHGEYSRRPSDFESDVRRIAASGIPVKTVHDAWVEIRPQLPR